MEAPPYVSVGRAYKEWEEIGASPWLVRQLRYGIQLPWRSLPGRERRVREYPLSPGDRSFSKMEIDRWLASRFIRRANGQEVKTILRHGCVSPAFVTSSAGKRRIVVDYKKVNEHLEERTFRMDQLADIAPTLRRDDCLFKADIKDGYYHLRLRRQDQPYLAFSLGGEVFVPACLNCGLKVAPWFFTKAMRPVVAYMRRRGHRMFSYIDDFYGAAGTQRNDHPATVADTRRAEVDMRALFSRLGLSMHPTKTDFSGKQALEILGIVVDTSSARFLLSPEKLRKVETGARRLLSYAGQHRRHVSTRALRSFAGLANSVGLAVVDARLRLRELFNALSPVPAMHAPRRQPRLSHAGLRDLKWWANLSKNPHVGRMVWPKPAVALFTDASMSGWGALWNGAVPTSGFFDAAQEGSSINELELLAAIHGLRSFLPFARQRHLELVTDSQVTAHIVRNLTSRAPRLHHHLRTLRTLCEGHGVTISTRHLPSVLNLWADRLSRRRDSTTWGLPSTAVALLIRRHKLRLLDGEGLPTPKAGAHGRAPLVLPRPALLPVWHRHLAFLGRGVMIAPVWPAQEWYQDAARRARLTPMRKQATPPWDSVLLEYARPPRQEHGVAQV